MKITIAALLHDIGKFYQRTGANLGNNSSYLRYTKKGSYYHACYTAKFIEENLNLSFESQLNTLLDLSAGHHSQFDGIVKEADIIASGHDRKDANKIDYSNSTSNEENGENYKITRLYSIFNEVKICENQKNELMYLNLCPLFDITTKKQNDLNKNEAELEYKKLYDDFVYEVRKIDYNVINNYTNLHHLIYPIIKNYTVTIPANTMSDFPTVSLFEHLKLTAAISSCIEKEPEDPAFIVLDYDVSGIQSFIYKITEGGEIKDKISKNLRARSFYISLLADFIAYYIISEFDLSYENVLYSSSGRGRLLLPNIKDFENKIKKICDRIEEELYQLHKGYLGVIFSYSRLDGKELVNLNLSDYRKDDKITLINSKNQKFKNLISSKNFKFINEPIKKTCKMCQIQEAKNEICDFCEYMLKLNDYILAKKNEFVVEFTYNKTKVQPDYCIKIGNLGYINFYLDFNYDSIDEKSYYLSINCHKIGEIKSYAMSLNKKISFQDIEKYNNINNIKGDNKIAVIKMDVDNLGFIFMKGLEGKRANQTKNKPNDKNTISKNLNLSRSLDMFFTYRLPKICGQYTYINYAGGDDLVIVVPASISLEIVEKIIREFKQWTINNDSFTISSGIDIFDAKTPIRYAIERADKFLNMSKDESGKNSFTIFNVSLSNDFIDIVNNKAREYVDAINKELLSRGVIYDIYSAILLSLDDTNTLNRYMSFIPHIAYSIKRNVTNDFWSKQLKETFVFSSVKLESLKLYKVILGITLMNTREEKNEEI